MACFAEYGYDATTTRVIAVRAGVTPPAVHHHFGEKHQLMFAVQADIGERFLTQLAAASQGSASYMARIQRLLNTLHQIVSSDRPGVVFGLVAREEARRFTELRGLTDDSDAWFAQLFVGIAADAVSAGEVRPGDESALVAALSVVSFGLAAIALDVDAATHRRVTKKCCELFSQLTTKPIPEEGSVNGDIQGRG